MTLAVAVCHPPDALKGLERSLGGDILFERAVILAADSLYSDESGQPKDPHGLKIVPLAQNVGAVFSGDDVTHTLTAVEELKLHIEGLDKQLASNLYCHRGRAPDASLELSIGSQSRTY